MGDVAWFGIVYAVPGAIWKDSENSGGQSRALEGLGGQILDTSVNLECGVDAQELSEQGCRDAFPVVLAPP